MNNKVKELRLQAEISLDKIQEYAFNDDGKINEEIYDDIMRSLQYLREFIEEIESDLEIEKGEM